MGGLVRRRSFEDVDGGLHVVYGGTAGDDTVVEAVAGETFDGGRIHEEDEVEAVVVGGPIQNGFSDGKFLRFCAISAGLVRTKTASRLAAKNLDFIKLCFGAKITDNAFCRRPFAAGYE